MNGVLMFILGAATTIYAYETYAERKGNKIEKLLPRKLAELLEECSMRVGERQKQLKRDLTEEEKDQILDKCYKEM